MTKPLDYNKLHDLTTQMKAHQQAIDDCQRQIKKLLSMDGDEAPAEPRRRGPGRKARHPGDANVVTSNPLPDVGRNVTDPNAAIAQPTELLVRPGEISPETARAIIASSTANHDTDRSNPEDAGLPDFLKREPGSAQP